MTLGPLGGPGQPAGPRGQLTDTGRDALSTQVIRTPTAADTHELGRRLAGILRAGDLLILAGPLGAGKTAFVQGVGAGLCVQGSVVSPTFVIARVHPAGPDGSVALVHVDAYRLGSLDEVDDLDLDVDAGSVVTAVEWGEGKVEQLADTHLRIELERASDTETRTVTLRPHRGDWAQRLADLARQ